MFGTSICTDKGEDSNTVADTETPTWGKSSETSCKDSYLFAHFKEFQVEQHTRVVTAGGLCPRNLLLPSPVFPLPPLTFQLACGPNIDALVSTSLFGLPRPPVDTDRTVE